LSAVRYFDTYIDNSVVADAGSYDVVVSGTCTPAVTSSPVTVTVNAAPIAPAFTQVNPTCLVGTEPSVEVQW
jgi:hypothetical protein